MDATVSSSAVQLQSSRAKDARAGRRLEYFTLVWNMAEAFVAFGAGVVAGSIALIGFGADSLIESMSGGILLWRLQAHHSDELGSNSLLGSWVPAFCCLQPMSRLTPQSRFCSTSRHIPVSSASYCPRFLSSSCPYSHAPSVASLFGWPAARFRPIHARLVSVPTFQRFYSAVSCSTGSLAGGGPIL